MVNIKEKFSYLSDGSVDIEAWLVKIQARDHLPDITLLTKSCRLSKELANGQKTFYGQFNLEKSLEVAETILDLKLDQDTAAAGMITCATLLTPPLSEKIRAELGETVAKLAQGVQQLEAISSSSLSQRTPIQIDNIRKMLLAMAKDIRVVIIKLIECLCFLRGIKVLPPDERKPFAQTVFDIYAPLANRLGIGQLKWELEDIAFRYQQPETYKTIAAYLAERRADREARVKQLIAYLKEKLKEAHISADIMGRAKHIYSIFLKMQRKQLSYQSIYDSTAVRILVPNIQDCYAALSIVHSLWPPIIAEFDDYIANPKPNGYRSIHTAVIGDDGKHFEIQIRTKDMHEEAERGVAAHWLYKENAAQPTNDATKITYLRQLLDWHQEISQQEPADGLQPLDEQIYVITPAGDILDLETGATPLDFAYRIHSQIGHRCRGAKVNGHIVPLSYTLRTGDRVEIITVLNGSPSRDWLNPHLGYIKTSTAKNKITHWFKQQAFNRDVLEGKQFFEREIARAGLAKIPSLSAIARHFNLKDDDALFAALNRGNVRSGQILHFLQPKTIEKAAPSLHDVQKPAPKNYPSAIAGGSDLLTRFAKCCKPIPGDEIIGYITQGRGISIHKKNCLSIKNLHEKNRFMELTWDNKETDVFSTDLSIIAEEQEKILSDLTSLLSNEKIALLSFHSNLNKNENKIFITLTVQIQNSAQLQRLLHRINQLPGVIEVTRLA